MVMFDYHLVEGKTIDEIKAMNCEVVYFNKLQSYYVIHNDFSLIVKEVDGVVSIDYEEDIFIKPPHGVRSRVCWTVEGLKNKKGNEIYELHEYCQCSSCKERIKKRLPNRKITATTDDITKVDALAEFVSKWVCEESSSQYNYYKCNKEDTEIKFVRGVK